MYNYTHSIVVFYSLGCKHCRQIHMVYAKKFLSSIWVQRVRCAVRVTYEFYMKSKLRLAIAGFKLSNKLLQRRVQEDVTPDKKK